jgi:dGTPase
VEAEHLSPLAARLTPPGARTTSPTALRTPLQRDRDRIVHSKAFRRLSHKTQVFIAPRGDHYRTRLTHTLEVTQIARTVARALALNEDLVEAIGLGHDLGHTPFGHVGEEFLDVCLRERYGTGFRHYEHSVRIVESLERDYEGLNLVADVIAGIAGHSGRADPPATLEARIVRVVDRVAYLNHDIDDAIPGGSPGERRPCRSPLGDTGSADRRAVHDLVEHSLLSATSSGDDGPRAGRAADVHVRQRLRDSVRASTPR